MLRNVNVAEVEIGLTGIKTAVNVHGHANIEDVQDLEAEIAEDEAAQSPQNIKMVSQDVASLLCIGMYLLQVLNTSPPCNTKLCRQLDKFLLIL